MEAEAQTPTDNQIAVHACKYDGRIHRRWRAQITRHCDSLIVLDAAFDEEVRHPLLGTITKGTVSTEYYWTDRWYSVFRFQELSGALRNYYCNINTPAVLKDHVLSFIDLDIDVLVHPDFSYRVLDTEEFEANAALLGYPPQIRWRAEQSLAELISIIDAHSFPFDENI